MGSDATLRHAPVLLAEALETLAVRSGGFYVDGTVGLGGHAARILERSAPDGRLLAVDRDSEMLALARERLACSASRVRFVHADFRALPDLVERDPPDGILLDLGVSSVQLDSAERGFSFRADGPLDMRLDRSGGATAAEAVNRLSERALADVIHQYGEERAARRITRLIVAARRQRRITTTAELATLVRRAVHAPRYARIDPATRTFQALRIHVNRELEGLGAAVAALARCLAPAGHLVVISFHSLEDREVKRTFAALAGAEFTLLTRKPLRPSETELAANPRARSARLRAIEKRAA